MESTEILNETLKMKVKQFDYETEPQYLSFGSPSPVLSGDTDKKHFVENTNMGSRKRKFIQNSGMRIKNRKYTITKKKCIKKCLTLLSREISEVTVKEVQSDNTLAGNLVVDEVNGIEKSPVIDNNNSCSNITRDLKARLNEETSLKNLLESKACNVSVIDNQTFENKIFDDGIEDISDASTDISSTDYDSSYAASVSRNSGSPALSINENTVSDIFIKSSSCVDASNYDSNIKEGYTEYKNSREPINLLCVQNGTSESKCSNNLSLETSTPVSEISNSNFTIINDTKDEVPSFVFNENKFD
ncbi:hypothetical protein NPIL_583021 [Nephila pilipes]|uniref:Uncharacterized protein n=1 Tax=Nephila pilipes TaxID=299642 RepID=A0A8X6PF82_NEPPI|nr:hypothetical protein NPIL_583021 [Nephila pilipes]